MNPILLARHVQDSLRELVHTTLNSKGRQSRALRRWRMAFMVFAFLVARWVNTRIMAVRLASAGLVYAPCRRFLAAIHCAMYWVLLCWW